MTEDEAIARGIHAQQILDDPLVVEAFAGLEAEYIAQWRRAASPDARETMWLLLQNLMTFRGSFQAYVRHGQVALAQRDARDKARLQDIAR